MVVNNVMVTLSSGGPMESMNPPRRNQRKKRPTGSATPATSSGEPSRLTSTDGNVTQNSPLPHQIFDDNSAYGGAKQASAAREDSGTPYFDPIEDVGTRAGSSNAAVQSPGALTQRSDRPQQQNPQAGSLATESVLTSSEDIVSTIEARPTEVIAGDAIVLDPADSPRQYAEDPYTALKREVWRPGDADGKENTDGHDMKPSFEKRWRFYQSSPGTERVSAANMPPKFVLLDDKAAYEVLSSDISKTRMAKFWPFDFVVGGKIRGKRAHRGRAAVANAAAEGDARYYFGELGSKNHDPYPFRGQKDYKAIIYRFANPTPPPVIPTPDSAPAPDEASKKRKATSPTSRPAASNTSIKRKHNNQHTPRELTVKYGNAPSNSKGRSRYLPRINIFLRRDPSPEFAKDRSKLYGNIAELAKASVGMDMSSRASYAGSSRVFSGLGSSGSSILGDLVVDMGPVPKRARADEEAEESLFIEAEDDNAADPSNVPSAARKPVLQATMFMADDEEDAGATSAATAAENLDTIDKPGLGKPRGTQITKPVSFMEQLATSEAESHQARQYDSVQDPTGKDSGSYAIQLERELVGANQQIQQLTGELGAAQARLLQLEAEIAHLKSGLTG